MRDPDAMIAFYRALGAEIAASPHVVSVYVGSGQMINFHRPEVWQRPGFTLRAPAAEPPCGDLCFVWDGSPAALQARLDGAGASVVEGPVAREGGRRQGATSVYARDPDGNLLEFMIYG
jgi:catechol 2,3-dioxygenase-like lactoylglutathione lyase family enzyme